MTTHPIRQFTTEAEIFRIGEGLLSRTLPRADWTHEAHLAACVWLMVERPDLDLETALPVIIRAYNTAVGGVNDDSQGYHETLTQLYIQGVRRFLLTCQASDLLGRVNALLDSELAPRDWPLRFYSAERLFSVMARRDWVAPDLAEI